MDFDRSYRSGSTSSEFFICFTSRPPTSSSSSSSSMKMSSKSIISPGRTDKFREPNISYSTSLSRRLKSNGSMRGGQSSPMFPTGNKKRGCAFENPEPSSPKVTCIGQVRVKKKKQGKMGARSRSSREVSFRKIEHSEEGILQQQSQHECMPQRNHRWVHLPLSICDALRSLGAEFNCFLPCGGRSNCSPANEREKGEKRRTTTSSCGAVFVRWFMALQEGEVEKRSEMELVVEEEEDRKENVFDEIEIEMGEQKGEQNEDEEGRVSICIPPRNALLLMRCRSEPLRMSAIANRFWDSSYTKIEDDEDDEDKSEDEEEEEYNGEEVKLAQEEELEVDEMPVKWVTADAVEDKGKLRNEENPEVPFVEEKQEQANPVKAEQPEEQEVELKEEEILLNEIPFESLHHFENAEIKEKVENEEEELKLQERLVENEENLNLSTLEPLLGEHENPEIEEKEEENDHKFQEISVEKEDDGESFASSSINNCKLSVQFEEVAVFEERVEKLTEVKDTEERDSEEDAEAEIETQDRDGTVTEQEDQIYEEEEEEEDEEKSKQRESQEEKEQRKSTDLPDCLLMMMCEPKLSMEVSKETWVCSTDFIRSRSGEKVVQMDGRDEWKNEVSTDSKAPQQQSSQSSCDNTAQAGGPTMADMVEQKLVNAVAYEPFVLSRCKSEPLRSSAKLVPESCFWTNQNLIE